MESLARSISGQNEVVCFYPIATGESARGLYLRGLNMLLFSWPFVIIRLLLPLRRLIAPSLWGAVCRRALHYGPHFGAAAPRKDFGICIFALASLLLAGPKNPT